MGEMNEALSDIQQLGLFERLPDGGVKLSLNRLVHAGTTKRHIASVGQAAASQVDVRFEERNTLFETCALSLSRLDFENFVVEFKRLVETFGSIEVKAGDEVGVFQLFCAVWPTTSQAP